jgi:hypothetical protein
VRATNLFLGLWRLLPLPCAKITSPADWVGTVRSPSINFPCDAIWTVFFADFSAIFGLLARELEMLPEL